jgi:DNA-directed RNA polymerase subunit delta
MGFAIKNKIYINLPRYDQPNLITYKTVGKKRIIKSYEQLSEELVEKLKEKYPDGYEDRTITFTNPRGEIEVAIPFETEEIYYLIKLPRTNAAEEEEDTESPTYDEFDNFESLEIGDDVQEDEE